MKRKSIFKVLATIALILLMSSPVYARQIDGYGNYGLYIDINSTPYSDNWDSRWGDPYGRGGCTWYAEARVEQLTGKNYSGIIYGVDQWWNTIADQSGFAKSQSLDRSKKCLACWSSPHIAVVEGYTSAGEIIVSSGGYGGGSYDTGYCHIFTVSNEQALKNSNSGFMGFIILPVSAIGDNTPPVISNVSITSKTKNSITIKCQATDNVGITDVSFVVYPAGTQPNDSSWHGCTNLGGGWWTYTYTVPGGGKYCIRLYGWDAGGNWGEYAVADQVFDMAPPVIEKLSKQTPGNGTVSCKVTDDVEVKQVRLATQHNGEGTVWFDPSYSDKDWYHFVIPFDNAADGDSFTAQVHAWDTSNNETTSDTLTLFVDKARPALDEIKVTDDGDVYDITCKVTYNKELKDAIVRLLSRRENTSVREAYLQKQSNGVYNGSFKKLDNTDYDNYELWIYLVGADGTNNLFTKSFIVEEKKHTHTPVKEADKAATCTTDGYVGATTCLECGQTITERQTIPATGHNWSDWEVMKAATEMEDGEEQRVCKNDASHIETRSIPKSGHKHTQVKEDDKPATCTEDGYIGATICSACKEVLSERQVVKATGHNYGEWTTVKEATESEEGVEIRICRNDSSHIETRTIPKPVQPVHTHTPVKEDDKAATCLESGYTGATVCAVCGETITQRQTIPATGHNWGEWTVVQEATDTTPGLRIRVCKNNTEHVEQEVIPVVTPVDDRTDVSQFNVRYYLAQAVYTGRPLKPIFCLLGDTVLTEGTDYLITYSDNIEAGSGRARIEGIGKYKGERSVSFPITAATNSISVTPLSKTVKYAKLKSKAQTVTIKATAAGEGAKTSFKLTSVPKKAKKYISMSAAGKITIKKGLAKGSYNLKIRVTSAATANYASSYVDKTIRIIVK